MVTDAIKSIYAKTNPQTGGLTVWLNIRSYPALLLFFSYGLGLVRSEKWATLKAFLQTEMTNGRSSTRSRFVDMFWYWHWEGDGSQLWNNIEGFERRHTPLSDHLNGVFSAWSPSFAGSTENFELLFERFEIMTSLADVSSTPETDLQMQLSQNNNQGYVRMPVGRSAWHTSTREQIFEELQSTLVKLQLKNAGYIPSEAYIDLFITNYGRMIRQLGWRW